MDARRAFPVPADLDVRMKSLSHDLQRARVDLATGRLPPERYDPVARDLLGRLEDLEAEAHARVLAHARLGRRSLGPSAN